MGKGLINAVVTNTDGKASVHYDGKNIDQLDIIIEDKFGSYDNLSDKPDAFPPEYHKHNFSDIVNDLNIDAQNQINIQDEIDEIYTEIDNIFDDFCDFFCNKLGQCCDEQENIEDDDNNGN